MNRRSFLICSLMVCLCRGAAGAPPDSVARMVSDVESIQAGQPFAIGVLIALPGKWHTYWMNPGDSGMAPEMEWRLPEGFTAGPIQWPCPRRFDESSLVTFGYERQVLLFREIQPPANLATGRTFAIQVRASWLICDGMCVPRTASLELALPSRAERATVSAAQPLFAQAREEVPLADPAWTFRTVADEKTVTLCVKPPAGVSDRAMARCLFYPAQRDLVNYGPQTWARQGSEFCLGMDRFAGAGALPGRLAGVLVVPCRWPSHAMAKAVDVALPSRARDGAAAGDGSR